jgi:hypothetical protein
MCLFTALGFSFCRKVRGRAQPRANLLVGRALPESLLQARRRAR